MVNDVGNLQRSEAFILSRLSAYKVPGISVAVTTDKEIIYSRGFGYRDLENGLPSTPGTLYCVGSITKSFTALSVMQLAEKGLIDLEDPVSKYLPIDLRSRGREVKVHHLLTHSSGFPSTSYAEALIEGFMGVGNDWLPVSKPEDILPLARDLGLWGVSEPGERFFYLNMGYVLLGLIISKVSGLRYVDYVRDNVLKPLGMKRSYFSKEEIEADPDVAVGYVTLQGKHVRKPFPYGITSDGGLFSNTFDLAKYLRMFLNRGEGIVSERSIKAMEKPYIEVPWQLFRGESYGYGLIIYPNFLGRKLIGHSGSVLTYTGFIGYIESEGVGVAVLENSANYPPSQIGMYVLADWLGEDPNSLPFVTRERILKSLEGVYESFKGLAKVTVKLQGDYIIVERPGAGDMGKQILVPEEVEEGYVKAFTLSNGVKLPAEFRIDEKGTELIIERYRYVKRA